MTELDLLVVGGLTFDRVRGVFRPGGAALFATEAAAGAGWRVGVLTAAGPEDGVDAALTRLRAAADVVECLPAKETIRFTHEVSDATRRLTLDARGGSMAELGAAAGWSPRAVLLAPVADEISPGLVRQFGLEARPPLLAAAVQGWLRALPIGEAVTLRPLEEIPTEVTAAIRGLDLVVASAEDLGVDDSAAAVALAQLREWAGVTPEIVVTAATAGALVDHGSTRAIPVARVVRNVDTTGAGDAFAALLTVRRAAGETLDEAAQGAVADIARFLERRERPGGGRAGMRARRSDLRPA